MCWTNGRWDERLHQQTVDLVVQDLSEGRKARGCVRKESSKNVLESTHNQPTRSEDKAELCKWKLTLAAFNQGRDFRNAERLEIPETGKALTATECRERLVEAVQN